MAFGYETPEEDYTDSTATNEIIEKAVAKGVAPLQKLVHELVKEVDDLKRQLKHLNDSGCTPAGAPELITDENANCPYDPEYERYYKKMSERMAAMSTSDIAVATPNTGMPQCSPTPLPLDLSLKEERPVFIASPTPHSYPPADTTNSDSTVRNGSEEPSTSFGLNLRTPVPYHKGLQAKKRRRSSTPNKRMNWELILENQKRGCEASKKRRGCDYNLNSTRYQAPIKKKKVSFNDTVTVHRYSISSESE